MTDPDSKPAKILVIEDNPADIDLLHHALDQQGEEYDLEVLQDGEAALLFVEEHRSGTRDPEPCLIVLDLHLPKYDGIEVLRQIKRAPALAHIHVMVLTSFASPSEEATIQALGAFCRIKPVGVAEFLELAADVLAICKGLAPTGEPAH